MNHRVQYSDRRAGWEWVLPGRAGRAGFTGQAGSGFRPGGLGVGFAGQAGSGFRPGGLGAPGSPGRHRVSGTILW